RGHTRVEERSWVAVDALDRRGIPSVDGRKRAGLIIIASTTVKRAALNRVNDFTQIFGWPRLGLIAYRQGSGHRRAIGSSLQLNRWRVSRLRSGRSARASKSPS